MKPLPLPRRRTLRRGALLAGGLLAAAFLALNAVAYRDRRASRPGEGHGGHKQEQFLAQVQAALEAALQTAAEPILNLLSVQEVVQQGGSLAVVVTPQGTDLPVDLRAATHTLEQDASMLRREVAAATTRKETPHLRFVVLPAGAKKLDE